jgi:hypothetical protein
MSVYLIQKLPSSGPLLLTDEELKLIKQEGYQIPAKLPLNKTEEKILKKIRRKIKNKVKKLERSFVLECTFFLIRFQLKKVVEKKKNMLIHWNDKLQNILTKMEHLKSVCQQWKKIKGIYYI